MSEQYFNKKKTEEDEIVECVLENAEDGACKSLEEKYICYLCNLSETQQNPQKNLVPHASLQRHTTL